MQFTDLARKFLINLEYPERAIVRPVADNQSDVPEVDIFPEFLIVDNKGEHILCAIALSVSVEDDDLKQQADALRNYCAPLTGTVEMYIIARDIKALTPSEQVNFFALQGDTEDLNRIQASGFPDYKDLLLKYHLSKQLKQKQLQSQARKSLYGLAYFFAIIFTIVAVGDVYVDRILGLSYLNLQRTVLLLAAALFLFLPRLVSLRNHNQT